MDDELYHYGVKGMKWGVRKSRSKSGGKSASRLKSGAKKTGSLIAAGGRKAGSAIKERRAAKKQEKQLKADKKRYKKRSVKDMSEEEIAQRIKRMELEKRYIDLYKSTKPQRSRGSQILENVLVRSGENIATQFTTYMFGTAVNKSFAKAFDDPKIVNPKKGQKD